MPGRQLWDVAVASGVFAGAYTQDYAYSIVDGEGKRLGDELEAEAVERALVNGSLPHQVQPLGPELVVLRQRLIHRVRVNAPDGYTLPLSEVLRQQRGHETLAHTSLTLQGEMHRSTRGIPCWIRIAVP